MIYLITFACYGCHLHGEELGSVDRENHLPGSPLIEADPKRVSAERKRMHQPPYSMDRSRREAVLNAMPGAVHSSPLEPHGRARAQQSCSHRDRSRRSPERIMNDLKSYASRWLNRLGLDESARKRWARHGSTRWLWKPQSVPAAIRYVVDEQGDSMAVFEAIEP